MLLLEICVLCPLFVCFWSFSIFVLQHCNIHTRHISHKTSQLIGSPVTAPFNNIIQPQDQDQPVEKPKKSTQLFLLKMFKIVFLNGHGHSFFYKIISQTALSSSTSTISAQNIPSLLATFLSATFISSLSVFILSRTIGNFLDWTRNFFIFSISSIRLGTAALTSNWSQNSQYLYINIKHPL